MKSSYFVRRDVFEWTVILLTLCNVLEPNKGKQNSEKPSSASDCIPWLRYHDLQTLLWEDFLSCWAHTGDITLTLYAALESRTHLRMRERVIYFLICSCSPFKTFLRRHWKMETQRTSSCLWRLWEMLRILLASRKSQRCCPYIVN